MRTRTSTLRRSKRATIGVLVLGVLAGLLMPFASAPAAQAVPGPEPISGSYVHWRVADSSNALLSGATFAIERSTYSYSWIGGSWSDFQTISTVSDCVAAGCSTTGDRDPDAGEFQVSLASESGGWMGSSPYRYRVRAVTAPVGYTFTGSTSAEMPTSGWNGAPYSFGTFVAAPRPAFACTAGTLYSMEANGAVQRITVANGTGTVSPFNGGLGLSFANALGVGPDGTAAYMVERTSGNTGVGSILRYTRANGWETVFGQVTAASTTAAVAGAVSLDVDRFYFGGPLESNGGFRLFSYDHATRQVSTVGTLLTGMYVNGDMAFDAQGNLLIVQGASVFTVSRSALAAASGGSLPYSTATGAAFTSDVNGIAIDADGSIFASAGTTVRRYVQSGGTWVLASSSATATIPSGSDLASCQQPVTVTVQKDVPARAAGGDQFTLQMRQGTTGPVLAAVTTSGTQPNVQAQRISGIRVPASSAFTITESVASGSAGNYSASWACTSNGQPYSSGSGTSIALTTPTTAGADVVCTFTNTTLVTSIAIRKDMQDVNGANAAPRDRWTVGAAITTGATQIGAVTTSNQQTAADGTASWRIRHTSASTSAQVVISEQQQSGFDFVRAYCDVTPLGGTTARTTLASATGSTLTIAPGSTVSCVFTNKVRPTTLTLVKRVTSGTASASLFTLTATGPAGALPGPTGATGAAATTNTRITPAVAYRLSESGGPATYTQVGSWTCVNQAGATVAVSTAGDITAAQGDSVTCTVRNATATLVILERVEGTASLTAGQFSITAAPSALAGLRPTTVTGAEAVAAGNTIQVRPGHSHALTSTSTAAAIGLRFERYTGSVGARGAVDHTNAALWVAADPAAVAVAAGETGIYRFVATAPTPLTLPLTGGIGSDAFVFGGSALLLLAAAHLLIRHRMRRPEAH